MPVREDAPPGSRRVSRGEEAAAQLIRLAQGASPGDRLGSKEELRARWPVSVGTFNEAVRIAQSRGVVTVRPGPGGGVFAALPSPTVRLGNSVLALDTGSTTVAEAMRIRDALDPLMVEDALWHASPADVHGMRSVVADMAAAVDAGDPSSFVRANWALHARIAAVSPNPLLRSLYVSLLDQIESHTLDVLPAEEQPLEDYVADRYRLHDDLVDAIDRRDRGEAMRLIALHATTTRPVPENGQSAASSSSTNRPVPPGRNDLSR
jgi:DNA-binding FadR family transcriptional regulator